MGVRDKHGVKINRLFFPQGSVGQQIDVVFYSKFTYTQFKHFQSVSVCIEVVAPNRNYPTENP